MNRELELLEKLEKELNLKELQIKSLLTITQAINDNVAAEGLYNMYRSFLSWEMGIVKMNLILKGEEQNEWFVATDINSTVDLATLESWMLELLRHKRLHTIKPEDSERLQAFDIIIPVFHKDVPIAYSLIGGIKNKEALYNKIQFITTITNIIAVAIENKRLFKRQLEQESFSKELELASKVQKMLIPDQLPKNERYELAFIYKPHFTIGGDYLDFIDFDRNRFLFCIADISGKGVAAALLMANFQAMIQSLIYQYRDLETFIFALNQTVFRITKSDKFITFFIAEVDLERKKLKYINAGHYPPVLYQDGEIKRLDQGSTVIGAFEKLPDIHEEQMALKEGALIMCFTDGLADLKNDREEYFADDRIEEFVRSKGTLGAEEFNVALMHEIDSYRRNIEFTDDIAVLTCKVHRFN